MKTKILLLLTVISVAFTSCTADQALDPTQILTPSINLPVSAEFTSPAVIEANATQSVTDIPVDLNKIPVYTDAKDEITSHLQSTALKTLSLTITSSDGKDFSKFDKGTITIKKDAEDTPVELAVADFASAGTAKTITLTCPATDLTPYMQNGSFLLGMVIKAGNEGVVESIPLKVEASFTLTFSVIKK